MCVISFPLGGGHKTLKANQGFSVQVDILKFQVLFCYVCNGGDSKRDFGVALL